MAAPRRIQQDRGGADTARPVSVWVLQRSVTAGGNFCARVPGQALMGWVWKS